MDAHDIHAPTMPFDDLFDSGPFRVNVVEEPFSLEKALTPDPDDRTSQDDWLKDEKWICDHDRW